MARRAKGDRLNRPHPSGFAGHLLPPEREKDAHNPPNPSGRLRLRPGFNLFQRRDHGVEGEQRGSMPRLIVADRLEHGDIRPFAGRRGTIFFQHPADLLADIAQFLRARAHDITRHDGGGRLPQGAGDHEVDCRTDQGSFMLKACFLRKA